MTHEEWMTRWNEGMAQIESVSVRLERQKHRLDVMEQRLDELDALETKTGLFRFMGRKTHV